jgi:2-polyprenyl-3-methyl-5-hydroxy-6-metoxy-1,4-benzoquinol methylase
MMLKRVRRSIVRILYLPGKIRSAIIEKKPNVIRAGRRAVSTKIKGPQWSEERFKKKFVSSEIGRACFEREILADRLYNKYPWKLPILDQGLLWFSAPLCPEAARLDIVGAGLDRRTRIEIARQAISAIFDIFATGYAHRDFKPQNLFWMGNRLLLVDFECLERYPDGMRPPFPLSYDIIGEGLESPFRTSKMGYAYSGDRRYSVEHVLGVSLEEAIGEFRNELKERIRQACLTFATKGTRHICQAERIYSSFELPYFEIEPKEAQRNSAIRLGNFGVTERILAGKSVLDLGCNIGGMLFAIQQYRPGRCLGIEYDLEKVRMAQDIAAYNGLANVKFVQADIDTMSVEQAEGPFDVVFCLAVEAHVKNRRKLYETLSKATKTILYFEGNSTTDPEEVRKCLMAVGFRKVLSQGISRDDIVPANNRRPLLIAEK